MKCRSPIRNPATRETTARAWRRSGDVPVGLIVGLVVGGGVLVTLVVVLFWALTSTDDAPTSHRDSPRQVDPQAGLRNQPKNPVADNRDEEAGDRGTTTHTFRYSAFRGAGSTSAAARSAIRSVPGYGNATVQAGGGRIDVVRPFTRSVNDQPLIAALNRAGFVITGAGVRQRGSVDTIAPGTQSVSLQIRGYNGRSPQQDAAVRAVHSVPGFSRVPVSIQNGWVVIVRQNRNISTVKLQAALEREGFQIGRKGIGVSP